MFTNIIFTIINNNRLEKALYFNDVTGGKNWLYFKVKSEKILKKKHKNFAVLAIINSRYNSICTCFGGEKGVELVEKMERCIGKLIEKNEVFAHYVDAMFGAILIYNEESELYERVQGFLKTFDLEEEKGIHIGVYLVPENGEVQGDDEEKWTTMIEHYFHHSKIACDSILSDESNYSVFDEKLLEDHLWEHKVNTRKEIALEKEEFVVYLQPKYNPKTKVLKGAEALVRWINEEDGFISPGKFIPIFEKNGFIMKLDDYMVEHVAMLQAKWISEGYKVVPVSVNISRAHFIQEDLAKHICEIVDKYNVPHNVIEIELTESAFFEGKNVLLSTVREMQGYGFNVSMDDFGSGYSSLNTLKDLPLNVLKLDAEFFRGEEADSRGEIIVENAITLAKELKMEIVAEGIEKESQVVFLADVGCDMIQGYYFDRPIPEEEYVTRMEKIG